MIQIFIRIVFRSVGRQEKHFNFKLQFLDRLKMQRRSKHIALRRELELAVAKNLLQLFDVSIRACSMAFVLIQTDGGVEIEFLESPVKVHFWLSLCWSKLKLVVTFLL